MRPTGPQSTAGEETEPRRRAAENGRRFGRRIDCDGGGYAAAAAGPARGGGMREPSTGSGRPDDPRR
jgi:hypothetical protein